MVKTPCFHCRGHRCNTRFGHQCLACHGQKKEKQQSPLNPSPSSHTFTLLHCTGKLLRRVAGIPATPSLHPATKALLSQPPVPGASPPHVSASFQPSPETRPSLGLPPPLHSGPPTPQLPSWGMAISFFAESWTPGTVPGTADEGVSERVREARAHCGAGGLRGSKQDWVGKAPVASRVGIIVPTGTPVRLEKLVTEGKYHWIE